MAPPVRGRGHRRRGVSCSRSPWEAVPVETGGSGLRPPAPGSPTGWNAPVLGLMALPGSVAADGPNNAAGVPLSPEGRQGQHAEVRDGRVVPGVHARGADETLVLEGAGHGPVGQFHVRIVHVLFRCRSLEGGEDLLVLRGRLPDAVSASRQEREPAGRSRETGRVQWGDGPAASAGPPRPGYCPTRTRFSWRNCHRESLLQPHSRPRTGRPPQPHSRPRTGRPPQRHSRPHPGGAQPTTRCNMTQTSSGCGSRRGSGRYADAAFRSHSLVVRT